MRVLVQGVNWIQAVESPLRRNSSAPRMPGGDVTFIALRRKRNRCALSRYRRVFPQPQKISIAANV